VGLTLAQSGQCSSGSPGLIQMPHVHGAPGLLTFTLLFMAATSSLGLRTAYGHRSVSNGPAAGRNANRTRHARLRRIAAGRAAPSMSSEHLPFIVHSAAGVVRPQEWFG
jgi:hypothetical protein